MEVRHWIGNKISPPLPIQSPHSSPLGEDRFLNLLYVANIVHPRYSAPLAPVFHPQLSHPCTNKFIWILPSNPVSPGTAQMVLRMKATHSMQVAPHLQGSKDQLSFWMKGFRVKAHISPNQRNYGSSYPCGSQSLKKNGGVSVKYSGTTLCTKEASCLVSDSYTKFS